MNYKTLLKLKDNNFPRSKEGKYCQELVVSESETDMRHYFDLYEPTLSELIEACGKPVMILGHEEEKYGWQAFNSEDTFACEVGNGNTPEEAVANLWLALHEK